METLFITRDAQLRRHENTLQVRIGEKKHPLPIERVSHVVMLSECRLNTRILGLFSQHNVRLSIFDYYGYYKGSFEPYDRYPSGKVKLKQAAL